jgi:alpha-L-rhamnosidase
MTGRLLGTGAGLGLAAGLPLLLVVASPPPVAAQGSTTPEVSDLRTEYRENPLGIDTPRPRLSWRLRSDRRGVVQSAYEIRVARSERGLRSRGARTWETGKVQSDESTNRPYNGPPLESRQRYYWQVRVWDDGDRSSEWSAPAWWEMGLLAPTDWTASWIEPDVAWDPSKSNPLPTLRRGFELSGRIQRARAYVTAHGLYEMHLNGRRVGDQLFTPGWTAYAERLQYQTYDVTSLLKPGGNAVGVVLGNGWYRGDLPRRRNVYGTRLGLLAQIEITYDGGRTEIVGTDGSWKATTGPILMSEIYHGETYDARLERPGWTAAGFDDHDWSSVRVVDAAKDVLVAPAGPPVRRIEEVKPVKILETPEGDTVVDMGQNMVGWVRLSVEGPAGTTVTLRHTEVLDKDGNFYTESLRSAKQTIRYTLKGGGPEVYEPHFTFQGFRYVAVDGYPGELAPESLTGIVIHSDISPSGALETSKPLVNQLQHNILWGQKGNFLDVPTDCPQRDERLGWTGDAEVFYRTAAFNFDVAGFFTKWLRDLAADQYENGAVPHVIPDVLTSPDRAAAGSAGWGDAAVIIPWGMYLTYGDRRLLEQQYDSMAAWVEYMRGRAGDDLIWDGDEHFGDWLAYAAPPREARSYPGATTGKDLIATAFFAHSTELLQRIAEVLGRSDDAARYGELQSKIKKAFVEEYVSPRGRVGENTQTAYVLALHFGLLPEDLQPVAAERLARDVRERGHLTTGFLGTPHLCHVLSRYGYLDEAYMLLNRQEYPSWLYPVTQGATTIWERWDGQKPDGTFQDPSMNSFNHYAYGAIGDWMYRVMAGIDTDETAPGYKHVLIEPRPGGGFTRVKAHHDTMYGRVGSAWTLEGGRFELAVEVPPNTTATVRLPGARLADVTESSRPLAAGNGIIEAPRQDGDAVVVEVGSGRYSFAYPMDE